MKSFNVDSDKVIVSNSEHSPSWRLRSTNAYEYAAPTQFPPYARRRSMSTFRAELPLTCIAMRRIIMLSMSINEHLLQCYVAQFHRLSVNVASDSAH
jgi:hypothetical protein